MSRRRKSRLPWNWRSRIEILLDDEPVEGSLVFTLSFKKGQTPKGFMRAIGSLSVCDKPPYVIEQAEIDEYFVRRGLGTSLYFHALNQLGSLTTLYHSASKAAQGLWRSLVRGTSNHRIDFFAGTLTVFKRP